MLREIRLVACVMMIGAWASGAGAQLVSSRFTYQGRLDNGSVPASGLYDLRFQLFTAPIGGSLVGTAQCADNLPIASDGTFTVGLDFGEVFDGSERYLEVQVRPDAGLACGNLSGFTTLGGRQRLLAAPYAAFAVRPWAPTGVTGRITYSGSFVGINSTSPATSNAQFQVSRAGTLAAGFGGMFVTTDNATGRPFYGYNNTTGGFLAYHYLDGSDNSWRLVVGSSTPIVSTSNGFVGVGTSTPTQRLDVGGSANVSGNLSVGGTISVPATTRYYTMGPGSFVPASAGANYNMTTSELFLLDNNGSYYGHLNLPQGAVLMDATLYFWDDSASNNITFILDRVSHNAAASARLANFTPAVLGTGNLHVQTLSFPDEVIDNQANSYTMFMTWDPDGANRISVRSVVFRYTLSSPGP